MTQHDLEVTDLLVTDIKRVLRITTKSYDDEIESIILEGKADIQSVVGPLSFDDKKNIVSVKGNSLLKVYCFYSWNDMKQDFMSDNKKDLLNLKLLNATEHRRSHKRHG